MAKQSNRIDLAYFQTVSAVIQPGAIDEDALDAADGNIKVNRGQMINRSIDRHSSFVFSLRNRKNR